MSKQEPNEYVVSLSRNELSFIYSALHIVLDLKQYHPDNTDSLKSLIKDVQRILEHE